MTDERHAAEEELSPQQAELKEHLDAIVSDVIVADKCYFLLKEISESSSAINEHNFGGRAVRISTPSQAEGRSRVRLV